MELEWKLQEQEQAAVKSEAAAVAAAVGAAEDRVKGQVEAELAVRLEAGKAEAEAGWSELVDILSAQAMEVRTNSYHAHSRHACPSSRAAVWLLPPVAWLGLGWVGSVSVGLRVSGD